MPRTKRPRVIVNPVANHYSDANVRVVEFSSENGGGLIEFRTLADGRLRVELYRCDPTVWVIPPDMTKG